MCIVLWTLGHPEYQLVIASNRDEYLSRPTLPAQWHDFVSPTSATSSPQRSSPRSVVSGLDLTALGTWLGVTQEGRFGFLTNFSEPPDTLAPSRGSLVKDYLLPPDVSSSTMNESPVDYATKVNQRKKYWAGFNLVIGRLGRGGAEAVYLTNREVPDQGVRALHAAEETLECCGVSNNTLSDNLWDKVVEGRKRLEHVLKETMGKGTEALISGIFDLLSTTNPASEALPSNILILPHHRLFNPSLPPSRATWYATRVQTIVLASRPQQENGTIMVTFVERDAWRLPEGDGDPVWAGDRREGWRLFQFEVTPN